jgi:hypothetical protein
VEGVLALERGQRARERRDVHGLLRRAGFEHALGGIENRPIARAAAQVAGERIRDLIARRHGAGALAGTAAGRRGSRAMLVTVLLVERPHRHHEARRAEAAL